MRGMLLVAATAFAVLALGAGSATAEGPNAIITNAGCQATALPANDDGSSTQVTLPFSVNFFGDTYNSLYVNNNGNVTFDFPMSTYTPFPLLTTNRVLIAPYFGDVDTRGPGSDTVHYGQISAGATEVGGHPAFCVNWVNVGYYYQGTDKLNSFQLVLIDRSDTGPGNFDIEFNYDKVQWEAGDASGGVDGLGGTPARIGYSNGTTSSFELPGSGAPGTFLDTNTTTGLIYNDVNSPFQLGRYVFPVRNGAATGHALAGTVYANDTSHPVAGAFLQACPTPADSPCRNASTNAGGQYVFTNLPDHTSGGGSVDHTWLLTVNPPGGSGLSSATLGPVSVAGSDVNGQDVILHGPQPLPAGASITTPSRGTESSGVPTVYWHDPLTLTLHACVGGTGTATLDVAADRFTQTVPLVESPAGTYTGTFDAPYPHHGAATISYTISCGGSGSFDLYIDPSGVVQTPGGAPIAGATVTLFRADDPAGPFVRVPDGSAIMSPGNQANPDTTGAAGHFGWDVLAGYYVVRAEKAGCTAPDGSAYAESPVLTIPPPVTGLVLTLSCGDTTPPVISTHADVTAEATGPGGATVSYTLPTALDDVDGAVPVTCAPVSGSLFALGDTTVGCSATDAAGNEAQSSFVVHVVDTTPPTVTVPAGPISLDATGPGGAVVTYTASASDLVDGAVTPTCAPASGSTFPAGDTTVSCTATDAHGNTSAPNTFTVHVRGAAEQLASLRDYVHGLPPGASLEAKVRAAQAYLAAGDVTDTCSTLGALLNETRAQAGKKLTAAQAAAITTAATRIRTVLGC